MSPHNKGVAPLSRQGIDPGHDLSSHHRAIGSDRRYFWLGVFLLTAWMIQQLTAWRWSWLAELQAGKLYMQLSGYALLGLIIYQWRFSLLRAQADSARASSMLKRHKLFGALAPLLFFGHSQTLGYAFLEILSLTFFLVFLTGLYNHEITRIRKPWFMSLWVTLHVGSSMALLFLMSYHIYISYAYK